MDKLIKSILLMVICYKLQRHFSNLDLVWIHTSTKKMGPVGPNSGIIESYPEELN